MKKPFIHVLNSFLLFLFLFIGGIYLAADFLIPVTIAALIASLCLPLCKHLEKLNFGRVFSILICLMLIIGFMVGFAYIFYNQVLSFASAMPSFQEMALRKFHYIQSLIQDRTTISTVKQMEWLEHKYTFFLDSGDEIIQNIFLRATHFLALFGLIFIYVFFFLLYRKKFKFFVFKFFQQESYTEVNKIINRIQVLSKDYFSGVLMVMAILGTMHTIGLMILGIEYPFFLGYLAALLIIIPYIGTIIGSAFAIIVALLTKDSLWYAVGVACVFTFNLFIENNILTPIIIGSKVKINALAVVIAIILGGMSWGIAGMILFIPLLGMVKIICDTVPSLFPFGYLLEDEKFPSVNYKWVSRTVLYFKNKIYRHV